MKPFEAESDLHQGVEWPTGQELHKTGKLLKKWASDSEGLSPTNGVLRAKNWHSQHRKEWVHTVADAMGVSEALLNTFEPDLLEIGRPKVILSGSKNEQYLSGYAAPRGMGRSLVRLIFNPQVGPQDPLVFEPKGMAPVEVSGKMMVLMTILHEWAHLFLSTKVAFAYPRVWIPDSVINVLEEGFADTVLRRIGKRILKDADAMRLDPSTKEEFAKAMEYMGKWYWRSARNYRVELAEQGNTDPVYVEGVVKVMRLYSKDTSLPITELVEKIAPLAGRKVLLRRRDQEYVDTLRLPIRHRLEALVRLAYNRSRESLEIVHPRIQSKKSSSYSSHRIKLDRK